VKILFDENTDNDLIRELQRRQPELDGVRVQDVGLRTQDDPSILEWAAQENRVLISNDRRTMPGFAYAPVEAGLPMPGVILLRADASLKQIIEEILILVGASAEGELDNLVIYLPMG
jgi:predicted nuclease of predicted toxin-antitoxin system